MLILVDVSAILRSSILGGVDPEAVQDTDGSLVNSVGYGYERAVNSMNSLLEKLQATPKNLVLVYETGASKAPRQAMYPLYKNGASSVKSPLTNVHFGILREQFLRTYRNYGAIAVTQDRIEADDVIAKIALSYPDYAIVYTVDNDLMVLAGKNPRGGHVDVITAAGVSVNKYGDFPLKDITIYKSLVGDSSDNIKGIKGFGEKAWQAFLEKYGTPGIDYLRGCLEKRDFGPLFEQIDECPLIRKIYHGSKEAIASYDVVLLRPEWVDTLNNPLEWHPGVNIGGSGDERFSKWEPTKTLIDARNAHALTRVLAAIPEGSEVAFDIETATPVDSDFWLEQQGSSGVDVIGSFLVGFSVTFGDCDQHSVYVDVRHDSDHNVSLDVVEEFLVALSKKATLVIHNTMFEGTVLYNEFSASFKPLGNRGLIRSWLDTKLESAYVDENDRHGLKHLSQKWLGYTQVSYDEVTGGRKMSEMTARETLNYGCDDTICTTALHNFFKLFMQVENTYEVYKAVEIPSSYLHAFAFIHGVRFDPTKYRELTAEDQKTLDDAQANVTST